MKRIGIIISILLLFNQFIAGQSKWYAEKGIFISTPAHDDMWQTHRISTGANWLVGYQHNNKLSYGARLAYDFYWDRKHFSSKYTIPQQAMHPFTVASLRIGVKINKKHNWFYGIETGSGILHTCGVTRVGLGWVDEYDGWTKYAFITSAYAGKNIFHRHKKIGNISLVWLHVYAERHAENFAGIRFNFIQSLK